MRATSGGSVRIKSLSFTSSDPNAIHLVGTSANGTLSATQCDLAGELHSCDATIVGWSHNTCNDHPDDMFQTTADGNIGVGYTNWPLQAKLDIRTNDNSSGTMALQISNSDGPLLQLKNDGSLYLKGPLSYGSGMNSLTNGTFFSGAPAYTTYYLGYNSLLNLSNNQWTFNDDNTVNGGSVIVFDGSGDMRFVAVPSTGGTQQTMDAATLLSKTAMMVKSNGQVGIGWDFSDGSHPVADYKLAVNGKIISAGARVQLTSAWPDYVFEKSHALMPLKKLEQYVYDNKHLPDMPASKEVSKDGIDLGEMNRLLVEKVEELSLYVIQLQKEIDELKKN